jgi:superfamily II DNA or RNA helicase
MEPIILDSMLRIPLSRLTRSQVAEIQHMLTLRVPSKSSYGKGPTTVQAFTRTLLDIAVPRNWPQAREFISMNGVDDRRTPGQPVGLTFNAELRKGQPEFLRYLVEGLRDDGLGVIGQAGCGFGKTVMAAALIAELDMTTLFLVHKEKLMLQFVEACEKFLGYTPGVIQGDRCEVEGKKICVAMVQSLYRRDYPAEVYGHFGLVIQDESHHVSAPMFSTVIEKFPSRYRVGLTATPRRGDKMEDIFFWHLGEIAAMGRGAFLDCTVYQVSWELNLKPGQWQFRGELSIGRMITSISKDAARTAMIAGLIAKSARAGRKSLVLSDRCDHLKDLQARLRRMFKDAGEEFTCGIFASGKTKKKEEQRVNALAADVTFGTWTMASEGLDCPEKDTVFFCTPKADIEQAAGRIRRLFDGKKRPMIIDVADYQEGLGVLRGLAGKRVRFYDSERTDKRRWPVKTVSRIAS